MKLGLVGTHGGRSQKSFDTMWDWKSSLRRKKNWDYFGHWKRTTEIVVEAFTLLHLLLLSQQCHSVTGHDSKLKRERNTPPTVSYITMFSERNIICLRNTGEALGAYAWTCSWTEPCWLVHEKECWHALRNTCGLLLKRSKKNDVDMRKYTFI